MCDRTANFVRVDSIRGVTMGQAFLLLVVLLTTIYLFYALLRPEKF